ncbi:MAG: hemin uptake protein HemP [Pseudomonadota bacterium]
MDGSFPLDDRATPRTTPSNGTDTQPHATVPRFDTVPAFDVRHLMGDGTTAHMVLDGQTYCLRITRSGKLILTK